LNKRRTTTTAGVGWEKKEMQHRECVGWTSSDSTQSISFALFYTQFFSFYVFLIFLFSYVSFDKLKLVQHFLPIIVNFLFSLSFFSNLIFFSKSKSFQVHCKYGQREEFSLNERRAFDRYTNLTLNSKEVTWWNLTTYNHLHLISSLFNEWKKIQLNFS
jgi:uncharacterized protein with PQ loop repeat